MGKYQQNIENARRVGALSYAKEVTGWYSAKK